MANEDSTPQPSKQCSRCKQVKPLDCFVRLRKSRDGRYSWCRVCHAAKMAQWRTCNRELFRERERKRGPRNKEHDQRFVEWRRQWRATPAGKESLRRAHLKNTYGLTIEQFDDLAANQLGKCALCLQTPKRLIVDHNHDTGRIRALLCDRCNSALGAFGDSITKLRAAIHYLETHS